MRRMRWLPALGLGLVLTGGQANHCLAQPGSMRGVADLPAATGPQTGLVPQTGVGSQTGLIPDPATPPGDPYQGLRVSSQSGAWLICIASFSGPESPDFARQMVAYFRNKYHIPAYVYDRADQERRRDNEEERLKAQQIAGYRPRYTRVEELCAILVGGYATVDAANAALKDIHKWPSPDIHLPSGAPPFPSKYDTVFDKDGKVVLDKDGKPRRSIVVFNPCETAFAIRNPVSPQTQPAAKPKFDPAWPKMNSDEPFSIYGCHKPWTLAIAQYTVMSSAPARSEPGMLDKLWMGGSKGDQVDNAALNAHELAKFLRHCNIEAYVLHTRTSSIVTMGGFTRSDDPNIGSARQQLLAVRRQIETVSGRKDIVQFFANPLPMEVPH